MLFKDNNHINKNYYLNLFSANADIIKNGNNNFMYEWNIRDLKLGKYCEIALVQLASINTNLSPERQYPSKAYNSLTNETTTTFLGKTVYTRDFTLNTSGITYGSGVYTMYISSTYTPTGIHLTNLLFDYNTDVNSPGAHFLANSYNANGVYNGTNGIVADYNGEWVILKLPKPIVFTKFNLIARNGSITRSPAEWRCYGSNDGITFNEIIGASQITRLTGSDYTNNIYSKSFNNSISYLYIGFTFNKIVGNGDTLNFIELQIFGKEEIRTIERQYPPKKWDTTGSITNTTYNGFPSYIIDYNITTGEYANGLYSVSFSNRFTLSGQFYGALATDLFDYDLTTAANFLTTSVVGFNTSGNYIGDRFLGETSFKGEWFFIKLPKPIKITKYIIHAWTQHINRNPATWKMYGSNDGINWEEIPSASNLTTKLIATDYTNNNNRYTRILRNPSKSYIYIGMCINSIISGIELQFMEFQIFGTEEINTISPGAWYQFDGSSTEMLLDSSGNNKTLTNFNNVSINTTDFKRGNGSAQFNGSNYFQINEPSYFSPNSSFSISLWMKLTNINNNYKTIFSCRSDTAGYNIYIVPTSYNMELWTPNGIGSWNQATLLSNYFGSFTNIWKHFTITFNKRTSDYEIKVYLDGILVNTIINNTYVANTKFNLRIGAGANELAAQFFLDNGSLIDDFRFYNQTLTSDQVLGLYNGIDPTQNNDNKFIIRALNTYDDGYDSQNTTSSILFADNQLTSPQKATYHKLNTYDLNRISLQVSNDIENKPYNGWDSNIQFGAVFHIRDYKEQD